MRRALIVGINYYDHGGPLHGCVDDAHAVRAVLERHGDGSVNFDCELLTGTSNVDRVNRDDLKDQIEDLFKHSGEISLFYFAGHGHLAATGGYILATDSSRGDAGLSLSELLDIANASPASNKVVILDSCHAGIAGTLPGKANLTPLSDGLTVLTASTAKQYAKESFGHGVFTSLLVDALYGSAASLTGEITPGSVYAHVDQSLGGWEQRPVFKTNVERFVSLRRVPPAIELKELALLKEFFPEPGIEFSLDPTFEPETRGRDDGMPEPIPENTSKFAILQKYNRHGLVVPVDAPHMWHAAMESKSCRLTALGEHYRQLVEKGRIYRSERPRKKERS